MQHLEVSGAVRPIYGSLGVKRLMLRLYIHRLSCHPIASWITKATDTHLEYVLIIAFPRQQWLQKAP